VALSCADNAWVEEACGEDDVCFAGVCQPHGDAAGAWILVDDVHSVKQHPSMHLQRDDYEYQGMHGFHRLFAHMEHNGYVWADVSTRTDGLIDDDVLAGFDVFFINLVSDDRPNFTDAEIVAILRYVEHGGGLFVIADHTNVYDHAARLNPLLVPMGVEVLYSTAMDPDPYFGIGGGAWVKIRTFGDHPINAGVHVASFQTGGVLETEHGVAFLSEGGFADDWINTDENPGFYGNWRLDPGEPSGALPVISANEFGDGRLVVVADQNIFGDEWLYVAHNFELASNIFEWLARRDGTVPPMRANVDPTFYTVAFELERSGWNLGWGGCSGFFPFFINFNRTPGVVARGVVDLEDHADTIVIANPDEPFDGREVQALRTQLGRGRTVILMLDVVAGTPEGWQLAAELLPDLVVNGDDDQIPVTSLPAPQGFEVVIGNDEFPVHSDAFDIDGLSMAGHRYPVGVTCPEEVEGADPYLAVVTATSGESLMTADVGGSTVDLARSYQVDGGTLIVFFHFGFWRNETLGWERQVPSDANADAHQVEYRFIDWLIGR
jgi:hypothetical protein